MMCPHNPSADKLKLDFWRKKSLSQSNHSLVEKRHWQEQTGSNAWHSLTNMSFYRHCKEKRSNAELLQAGLEFLERTNDIDEVKADVVSFSRLNERRRSSYRRCSENISIPKSSFVPHPPTHKRRMSSLNPPLAATKSMYTLSSATKEPTVREKEQECTFKYVCFENEKPKRPLQDTHGLLVGHKKSKISPSTSRSDLKVDHLQIPNDAKRTFRGSLPAIHATLTEDTESSLKWTTSSWEHLPPPTHKNHKPFPTIGTLSTSNSKARLPTSTFGRNTNFSEPPKNPPKFEPAPKPTNRHRGSLPAIHVPCPPSKGERHANSSDNINALTVSSLKLDVRQTSSMTRMDIDPTPIKSDTRSKSLHTLNMTAPCEQSKGAIYGNPNRKLYERRRNAVCEQDTLEREGLLFMLDELRISTYLKTVF